MTQNPDGSFTYDGSVAFARLAAGETATDSFKYTVGDGQGGTSTATVNVTITGVDNQEPVAALETSRGDNEAINSLALDFDASASFDPDGTLAEYQFDFGDGNTQTAASPIVSHTYLSNGDYTATLTVIDNDGAPSAQVDFGITVRDPAPLIADFTTIPETLIGPVPFTVDAMNTSTSADTMVTDVAWEDSNSNTGSGDTFMTTFTTAGLYTISMQITDELGRVAMADANLTVTPF